MAFSNYNLWYWNSKISASINFNKIFLDLGNYNWGNSKVLGSVLIVATRWNVSEVLELSVWDIFHSKGLSYLFFFIDVVFLCLFLCCSWHRIEPHFFAQARYGDLGPFDRVNFAFTLRAPYSIWTWLWVSIQLFWFNCLDIYIDIVIDNSIGLQFGHLFEMDSLCEVDSKSSWIPLGRLLYILSV